MKRIILSIFIFLSMASSHADGLKWSETKQISTAFMGLVAEEKYSEAYKSLVPYWFIPEHEVNALIYQTEQQMPQIRARFGKSLSYELVRSEDVGESIIKDIYIQKFENHALVWMIIYYKAKDSWKVNSVIFNDQILIL